LNPARARQLGPEQPLSEYRWSRWPEYLKRPWQRWGWLRVDRLLGEYRMAQDRAAGRRPLAESLERRRSAEEGHEYKTIRRGGFLGNAALKQAWLAQMGGRAGENHSAAERQESDEARARGMVAAELKRLGGSADELAERPKGDARKGDIAWRLRTETTMTLKWIAGELRMGAWTHVSNLLSQRRQRKSRQSVKSKD